GLLQWGRRPTPTETGQQQAGQSRVRHASMGPPAYADGDTWRVRADEAGLRVLQWGRRPTPTETCTQLQRIGLEDELASMGPPAYADGDQRDRLANGGGVLAS